MIFIAGFVMGAATVIGVLVIAACAIWKQIA
ncbi:hypothetical protein V473_02525 [Sphingobium cupriresistens LL01]|uniref:Uncharacterized protein n=1 Tax=Sphingobium cupriresistens LL01 TaxID=1420583 RepID=A0A0J7Y4U6_9SPHN|nr:hypothetical protein V473_02525 [Sphingobium cupriresistens LL01]